MRIRIALFAAAALLLAGTAKGQQDLIQGRRISAWLNDLEGSQTRARAEKALREGGTNTVAVLLKMVLAKGKEQAHDAALSGFAVLGTNAVSAIPDLMPLFLDFDRQNDGLSIMLYMGDAAVKPLETVLLTHRSKDHRMGAAIALGRLYAAPAIPAVVKALGSDPNAGVRVNAAHTLGNIRLERDDVDSAIAVPGLVKALSDKSAAVRNAAAESLVKYRKEAKEATGALLQASKDRDPSVAYAAATCLAYIDPEEGKKVIPVLFKAARHPDWTVANSAVTLLRRIAPEEAEKARLRTIDPFPGQIDPAVEERRQQLAAYRERELTPNDKQPIANLIAWLKEPDLLTRRWSIEILASVRPVSPEVRAALVACLKHPDYDTAYDVSRWLALLHTVDPDVTPSVIKLFESDLASSGAEYALRTLEQIGLGARQAVPALIMALDHEKLRLSAVSLLATIGSGASNAVPHLINLYENAKGDDHYPLRRSLTIAFGRIGPPAQAAVPLLLKRFRADEPDVVRALCRIDPQHKPSAINVATAQIKPPYRFANPNLLGLLGDIGAAAASARPRLIALIESRSDDSLDPGPSDLVLFHAAWSLWRIDPEQKEKVVPILESIRRRAKGHYDRDVGWGAVGALWQIEPALRPQLRKDIVKMLTQFRDRLATHRAFAEMKPLEPALLDLTNDSQLEDLRPWALLTICLLNGAGPEFWSRP